jgi:hypothetical protein
MATPDDEGDRPSSGSLLPSGYYMPAGIPTYTPLYLPTPQPDGTMGPGFHYGYGPTGYNIPLIPSSAPLPQLTDHTDIMSIIPTLRCWSCSKCGNLNYAHRLTCNLRKCQRMSELNQSEADWMCACGNVNYRFRKYCNLRKCQLPQIGNPFLFFGISQLIKAGYAPQSALSLLLTNSPTTDDTNIPATQPTTVSGKPMAQSNSGSDGCWQCVSCGNLNWPWREECNRRGCVQLRRDSVVSSSASPP